MRRNDRIRRVAMTVLLPLVIGSGDVVWISDMWQSNLSRLDVVELSVMLLVLTAYSLGSWYEGLWPRRERNAAQ